MALPDSCARLSDRDVAAWLVGAVCESSVPSPEAIELEMLALHTEQSHGRLRIDTRPVDGLWHTVLHYDDGATVWIPMLPDAQLPDAQVTDAPQPDTELASREMADTEMSEHRRGDAAW